MCGGSPQRHESQVVRVCVCLSLCLVLVRALLVGTLQALELAVTTCGVACVGRNMGLALQLEGAEYGKRRQQLDHKKPQMLQNLNYIL